VSIRIGESEKNVHLPAWRMLKVFPTKFGHHAEFGRSVVLFGAHVLGSNKKLGCR